MESFSVINEIGMYTKWKLSSGNNYKTANGGGNKKSQPLNSAWAYVEKLDNYIAINTIFKKVNIDRLKKGLFKYKNKTALLTREMFHFFPFTVSRLLKY